MKPNHRSAPRHAPRSAPENPRVTAGTIDMATEAVAELLEFAQPADAMLSRFFRDNKTLGPRERAFIAEAGYAVLRRKRFLERLCAALGAAPSPRHLLLAALLRLQGMGSRQLADVIGPKEAEWLGKLKGAEDAASSPADQADFPDWLAERLLTRMSPDELITLAQGLNQPAPLDLRVNPIKAKREEVLAVLAADGIEAAACPFAPLGIRLKAKPNLAKHPLFLDGSVEVQDEGSQLLGHLLAPKRGEMVVDFCAGAGGKTLLLGALMRSTGRLYAFDVSDRRLAKMKPRVARSGLSNVHPVAIASENDMRVKRLAGKIDRVLVDAPCSGLGTLRRNPDLKWRQSEQSVAELTVKQAAILESAARLVKPGGRLVYATCSLLTEENADIVAAFLEKHPEFQRLNAGELLRAQGIALECGDDLALQPHIHGTDGFYAAVLEKVR